MLGDDAAAGRRILERLMDALPDGLIAVDADVRAQWFNLALARIVGFDEVEARRFPEEIGRHLRDRVHDGQNQPFAPGHLPLQRALRGEPVEDEHLVVSRPDGEQRIVGFTARRLLDDDGTLLGAVGIARDRSEHRTFEQAMLTLGTDFEAMVSQISDVIAIIDEVGVIHYASPSVRAVLGHEPSNMVGRSVLEVIHPDDVDFAIERLALSLTPDAMVRAPDTIPLRLGHADGTWRHMEALGRTLYSREGRSLGIVTARDVTDRVEAEQRRDADAARLRALSALAPIGIAEMDVTGRITYVNERWAQILRMGGPDRPTQGEGAALGFLAILHPDDVDWVVAKRIDALERQLEGSASFRVVLDGEVRWISARSAPVRDEHGVVTGYVSSIEDITALVAARDAAEEANRAKSEFLSRMSHELRTPLNSVIGFGQLLQMGTLDPEQSAEAVALIMRSGRHLLNLINEVLDIARIESGALTLSIDTVQLAEIVRYTVELIGPQAEEAAVTIAVDEETLNDHWVAADRQRLVQVLLNLLSNAVKYNRRGGSVRVTAEFPSANLVALAVRDTGPGIAPELLGRLFSPFDRLGAESTTVEGTGIGLSLSKGLVEQMGGTLDATSTLGQGSCFSVTLARRERPARFAGQDPERAPTGGVGTEATTEPPAPFTVAYIEDNPVNVTLVERTLGLRPHVHLVTAQTGEEGLELVRRQRPDLVLLDLHLPDIGGDEVLARLRADEDTRAVPVVVLTADARAGLKQRLTEAGASGYLTKPLELGGLLRLIDDAVESARGLTADG